MKKKVENPSSEGKFEVGYKKPPKERQFGQPNGNPRHVGAWKKEDSARFKLEQMLKLSEDELKKVHDDKQAPLFERKLAISIAKGDWKTIESMMNQVYGFPKQPVEKTELEPPKPLSPRKRRLNDKD